jgi:DNA transformation protein
MKSVNELIEHLNEVFRPFGLIHSKPMFGGYGIYHQGLMMGLVANDALYLKTDALSAPQFSQAGCLPFEYTKNGTTPDLVVPCATHFTDALHTRP